MTKEDLDKLESAIRAMPDLTEEQRLFDSDYTYSYLLGRAVRISSNSAHAVHQLHMARDNMLSLIQTLRNYIK